MCISVRRLITMVLSNLSVVAVSQEASSGSTALSSPVALNFTLKPVSEEPSVNTRIECDAA